jgi:hypothetical protein
MEAKAIDSPFSQRYLTWDVFLTGGFSILTCLGAWIFVDKSSSLVTVSQLAFSLAFAVNHPHFLSSYMLLYGDFRKSIFTKKRYFFSALIVPLILFSILAMAFAQQSAALMGHIVTAMYFLVGWHYVKQIFGFVVVSSAQRKIYYQTWERRLLLTNLIAVWFMSSLASHVSDATFEFYGIKHYSLPHFGYSLPPWTMSAIFWIVGISFCGVVAMQIQKYIRDGSKPAPPGVAAFFALYVWYLPTMSHPGFGYLIPFFHSMQYLTFVWLMKKNQVSFDIKNLKDEEWRAAWINKFGGFAITALITGALAFQFIPNWLDSLNLIPAGTMGTSPFLAGILLFINIHHYFIDNTIWRSDNEVVRKFLVQPATTAVNAKGSHKAA